MQARTAPDDADFYTVAETATKLRCSEKAVREAIDSGRLPAVQVGPHIVRVPRAGLLTKSASDRRDAPTHAATEGNS